MFSKWILGYLLVLAGIASVPCHSAPSLPLGKFAEPLATPQFRRFSQADGLPGVAIHAVVQDSTGYLWFGGPFGLLRYDGVEFDRFTSSVRDPHSLSGNDVTQLLAGDEGRLWVATGGTGLNRYDPRTGEFEIWRHRGDDPHSLSNDTILALASEPGGGLLVGTKEGLNRLLPDGRSFERVAFPYDEHPDSRAVSAVMRQSDGTLWLGTRSGRLLRRALGDDWQAVAIPGMPVESSEIHRIDGDADEVRISTRHGLFLIPAGEPVRPAFAHTQLASPLYVFGSVRDGKGRLWVATIQGLVMEDERSRLHRFRGRPLMVGGLPGEWVLNVMKDREGGLWFTFYDGAVAYLRPGWEGFSRYAYVPDDVSGLPEHPPSVVAPSADGKLWVGSHGRIDKFDPITGISESAITGLHSDVMHIVDDGNTLWFTMRGELWRMRNGKSERVDPQRRWITRPELLARGDDGTIFVTVARYGVLSIRPDSDEIRAVPMAKDIENVDLRPGMLAVHEGRLWYGNHDGLLRWSLSGGQMTRVSGVNRGKAVTALTFDNQGFWLGRGDVLERYRFDGNRAVETFSLDAQNGWHDSVITDLNVDSTNVLWIFSESGLWSYDAENGGLRRFGAGVLQGTIGQGTAVPRVSPDSEPLYVPTKRGVIGFYPGRATRAPISLPLLFTEIRVDGGRGRRALVARDSRVTMSWQDRDLYVEARILSYADAGGIRYRFRMHGVDDDWVDVGQRGARHFPGLASGSYRLEVTGLDAAGNILQSSSIWLHVEAPPWLRWWAWVGYLILLMAAGWGALLVWKRRMAQRHRIQLSEERRRVAEQASAAKTQFLATLGHEIRTPMTGVLGMAELLLDTPLTPTQSEYAAAMRRSGTLLLKLVNDALDLAQIETGRLKLEPALFSLRDLVDDIAQLQRPQAAKKGLAFELDMSDGLPVYLIGDVERIKQILLNLANNAIKFTEQGKVTLRVEPATEGVVFSVIDTGMGIAPVNQQRMFERYEQGQGPERRNGNGLGLAICRELTAMMGGSLSLTSKLSVGSCFRVHLPLVDPGRTSMPSTRECAAEYRTQFRLLLVEDDPIVGAVIVGLLQRQGHVVCHVKHGLAAMAELVRERYDAVLLDLDLPEVDGLQIARMIRGREAPDEHLPIIAVTARATAEDEQQAILAGMDGFLRKPLTGKELGEALAAVLEPRHATAPDAAKGIGRSIASHG
jgi:signal transduction histidine kinase/ligand-binding sensor domain-containing protein/CheY-like chemotaxis protein